MKPMFVGAITISSTYCRALQLESDTGRADFFADSRSTSDSPGKRAALGGFRRSRGGVNATPDPTVASR